MRQVRHYLEGVPGSDGAQLFRAAQDGTWSSPLRTGADVAVRRVRSASQQSGAASAGSGAVRATGGAPAGADVPGALLSARDKRRRSPGARSQLVQVTRSKRSRRTSPPLTRLTVAKRGSVAVASNQLAAAAQGRRKSFRTKQMPRKGTRQLQQPLLDGALRSEVALRQRESPGLRAMGSEEGGSVPLPSFF